MGEKTAGVGHFAIPTAPAAGTSCTSGAANVFTTTYVQLTAATSAAIFITGIYVEQAAVAAGTYIVVQLATGAAAAETIVGQHLIAPVTGSTVARCYKPIYPPIPVANAIRIACKTADSVGTLASLITLECINQSNVVDDGVAVASVTTVTGSVGSVTGAVGSVTGLTASNLDAAISSRMATYTQPSGFLAATFPTGTVANTTNITAGTIATVTNLTNAPTSGDFTATMKTSIGTAVAASAVASVTGNVGGNVTGSVGSVTAAVSLTGDLTATMKTSVTTAATAATPIAASVTGAVGSVVGLTAANLDTTVSSRLASASYTAPLTAATTRTAVGLASANLDTQLAAIDADVLTRLATSGYTAPDNTSVAAIKLKTDSLNFTVAGQVNANIKYVNGVLVNGDGSATKWGP